jgi:hypothetical protein
VEGEDHAADTREDASQDAERRDQMTRLIGWDGSAAVPSDLTLIFNRAASTVIFSFSAAGGSSGPVQTPRRLRHSPGRYPCPRGAGAGRPPTRGKRSGRRRPYRPQLEVVTLGLGHDLAGSRRERRDS